MKRRGSMPTVKKIREAWADRLHKDIWGRKFDCVEECLTNDGSGENSKQWICFACGIQEQHYFFQRAHIKPVRDFEEKDRNMKVSNNPTNLHILCGSCHTVSEDLQGLKYFRWFKNIKFNEGMTQFSEMINSHFKNRGEPTLNDYVDDYFYTRLQKEGYTKGKCKT